MNRSIKFIFFGLLFIAIVSVRYYQESLFYDPLLYFFQGDFINAEFPQFNLNQHLLSISGRYWLNTLLSIGVILLIFPKKSIFKITFIIYLIIFVVAILLYYYFIQTEFQLGFTAGFYVRRILMQPVLLLLLIPGIWYIEKQQQ